MPAPAVGVEPTAGTGSGAGTNVAPAEPAPAANGSEPATPAAMSPAVSPAVSPAAAEPAPPIVEADPTGGARFCLQPAQALLLDFDAPSTDPTQALFGDFTSVLSGGTYFYPPSSTAADGLTSSGLTSDVSLGAWQISGAVTQQSGFGIFLECQLLDASRFSGIAFRISGNVEAGQTVRFSIGTSANDVSRLWLLEHNGSGSPSFGRCSPAESQFDGTCVAPHVEIQLSPEPVEVVLPFSLLLDGSPEASVNPAEISTIAWALPSPIVGESGSIEPYAVELLIDDVRFILAE